jgi:serine/threonine protein phosphatase PrpC
MLDLEFAELSDTGPTRDNNEDCCGHFVPATPEAAQSRGWCFAIADGVGGQAGGEVASSLAIETLLSRFPSVSSTESLTLALPRIIQLANQGVYEAAADVIEKGHRAGSIATTIVACAIRYDRATIAHVGDSRCYLIRRGEVAQLTRDHTVANEHRRLGILTSRQAASATTKNLLSRSLGNELFVNVDTSDHLLTVGDVLLLCSDGLSHSVTPSEMASALNSKHELEAVAAKLVSLANARDGSDNVSVQIIRIKSVESVGMYRGRLYKLPPAKAGSL